MITTILIKEGRKQLILDPETEADKVAVEMFKNANPESVNVGSFYDCQGGWTRQGLEKDQLIIVFNDVKKTKNA